MAVANDIFAHGPRSQKEFSNSKSEIQNPKSEGRQSDFQNGM
jgi:hypothetical protein